MAAPLKPQLFYQVKKWLSGKNGLKYKEKICFERKTVAHQTDPEEPLTDLLIRAKAQLDSASMTIEDLKLNGEAISESLRASLEDGGVTLYEYSESVGGFYNWYSIR